MSKNNQTDLFGKEVGQPDLFGPDAAPPAYRPDPDKVRARLHKILGEARAASKVPWEPTRLSLYRTIFPQMTLWLPDEEAAQLRFAFEAEMPSLPPYWLNARRVSVHAEMSDHGRVLKPGLLTLPDLPR